MPSRTLYPATKQEARFQKIIEDSRPYDKAVHDRLVHFADSVEYVLSIIHYNHERMCYEFDRQSLLMDRRGLPFHKALQDVERKRRERTH